MIHNLSKIALENGGSLVPLLIPSSLTQGTGLTNPSVYNHNGKIYVNLRHVQYSLYQSDGDQLYQTAWGPLSYFNPEDDLTLRTTNYLCELDRNTLNVLNYNKIDTSELDVKPIWEFIGLEDARIAVWDDNFYLTGVRRDTTTNGVGRMELSKIINNSEVSRARIQPPTDSYCEKNWMPILDLPYHYVKWTCPTEVVKVDPVKGTSETVTIVNQDTIFPRDIRGGSQVISYRDMYIAVTHEVDLWKNSQGNKDAQYYHRFIVWDKDWKIVYSSDEFKFLNTRIEFSCGLALQENDLIITFGYQDTTAFALRLPCKLFESLVGMGINTSPYYSNARSTSYTIESFAKEVGNASATFEMAKNYYTSGHFASAMTFYLKSAENSFNKNTVYSSLLMIPQCMEKLDKRKHAESIAYMNAISYAPERPEAYFLLSKYYELQKHWHSGYTYACLGLANIENSNELADTLNYYGEHGLLFQKAVCGWWIGRDKESIEIFKSISQVTTLPEDYMQVISNNLKFLLGDKYKLENFPLINIVSLDESIARREELDNVFKTYDLKKYKFYVYNRYVPGDYNLLGDAHKKLKTPHIGAAISYLNTIKQWYEESDEEYGFFCEDDISFETVHYWTFTWSEFYNNLPSDWEAVQLCLLSEVDREIKFTIRNLHDWGGQACILKRSYVEKLLKHHIIDNAYLMDIPGKPDLSPCGEHVLFDGIGKVYNFPLFVESQKFESTYSGPTDPNGTNARGYRHVINWWKSNKLGIKELLSQ
jgi:predicted GH43/DUF377 family glycosyl hydrolase/tetratricopeptide (TPR) repeat protein